MATVTILGAAVAAFSVAALVGWCVAGASMRRRSAEFAGYREGWASASKAFAAARRGRA